MSNDQVMPSEGSSPRDVLRDMWAVRRVEAETDLSTLSSVLNSLADSPDDVTLRTRAQTLAHQLVGVFGVFGFTEVKNSMARIDIELSDPAVSITELVGRIDDIRVQLP